MTAGTIIILNGTSSAGKTTLARALQKALLDPYLCLGIDTFLAMLPHRYYSREPSTDPTVSSYLVHTDAAGPWVEMQIGAVEDRVGRAMYSAIAALADHGNNVIFDDVMTEHTWMQEAVLALQRLPVLLVGVHCPLTVVEQPLRFLRRRPTPVLRWHRVHCLRGHVPPTYPSNRVV
jgi:chloramphenicol 3-O phosphotransferase